MANAYTYRIPEDALVPITFSNTEGVSTDGLTVQVWAVDPSDATTTLLGSGSGAAPGTDFSVTLDFSAVTPGKKYELQGAANVVGSNPVTVIPNAKTADHVYVYVYSMDIF